MHTQATSPPDCSLLQQLWMHEIRIIRIGMDSHICEPNEDGQINVQFNSELTTAKKIVECNLVCTHSMQLADLDLNFDHVEFRLF